MKMPAAHSAVNSPAIDVAVWLVMRHCRFVHELGVGIETFWPPHTPSIEGAEPDGVGEDGEDVEALELGSLGAKTFVRCSKPQAPVASAAARAGK